MEYAAAGDEQAAPRHALRSRSWLTHEQQQIVSTDLNCTQVRPINPRRLS
jgi:hypothetical protein